VFLTVTAPIPPELEIGEERHPARKRRARLAARNFIGAETTSR
jgi:hypothetical protein